MNHYETEKHPIIVITSGLMIFFGIWIFLIGLVLSIVNGSVSSLPTKVSAFLIITGVLLLKLNGKFQFVWLGLSIVLVIGGYWLY